MSSDQNPIPIFSGEFCHKLDPKNRVSIPACWRKTEADEFYLMADIQNRFLRVMPPEQFRAVADKINTDPAIQPKDRSIFLRHFFSRSKQAVADKQGRLVIPEDLRTQVKLEGDLMLIGAANTIELWNKESWETTKKAEEGTFAHVAELVGLLA